jgi:hypothetical protein
MFDTSIVTEELRIEGVQGEFARAARMWLELAYLDARQTEDAIDPLFIGRVAVPANRVLSLIDTWCEGHTWMRPKLRTLAVAIDALEYRNFVAELNAYANDLTLEDLKP